MLNGKQTLAHTSPHQASRPAARRAIRILLVGGLNTAFGYGIFFAMLALTSRTLVALTIATLAGTLFNFVSTGSLVFGSRDPRLLWRFLAGCGLVYLVNAIALTGLEPLRIPAGVAQALLLPAITMLSYHLNARIVFVGQGGAGLRSRENRQCSNTDSSRLVLLNAPVRSHR